MDKEKELEELIKGIDLDRNGVSDVEQVQSFFSKVWTFIKARKWYLLLCTIVISELAVISYMYTKPKDITEIVVEKEIIKTVEKDNIIRVDGNHLIVNLDDMYKIVAYKKNFKDGEKFRVAKGIELESGTNIFITIDEPLDKLDYNKKYFTDTKKDNNILKVK